MLFRGVFGFIINIVQYVFGIWQQSTLRGAVLRYQNTLYTADLQTGEIRPRPSWNTEEVERTIYALQEAQQARPYNRINPVQRYEGRQNTNNNYWAQDSERLQTQNLSPNRPLNEPMQNQPTQMQQHSIGSTIANRFAALFTNTASNSNSLLTGTSISADIERPQTTPNQMT